MRHTLISNLGKEKAYLYWPCREVWRRLRNEDVWLITRKGSVKGGLKKISVGDFREAFKNVLAEFVR